MKTSFTLRPGALYLPVILFLITFFIPQRTDAICCHSHCECYNQIDKNYYNLCGDCTIATPYCATGICNIFGCNCDGHCRTGGGTTCNCPLGGTSTGNCNPSSEEALKYTWAFFNHIDQNGDKKIHYDEFKKWADEATKDLDMEIGKKHFDVSDADKSGFIEPLEFDQDLTEASTAGFSSQWLLIVGGILLAVLVLIGLGRYLKSNKAS